MNGQLRARPAAGATPAPLLKAARSPQPHAVCSLTAIAAIYRRGPSVCGQNLTTSQHEAPSTQQAVWSLAAILVSHSTKALIRQSDQSSTDDYTGFDEVSSAVLRGHTAQSVSATSFYLKQPEIFVIVISNVRYLILGCAPIVYGIRALPVHTFGIGNVGGTSSRVRQQATHKGRATRALASKVQKSSTSQSGGRQQSGRAALIKENDADSEEEPLGEQEEYPCWIWCGEGHCSLCGTTMTTFKNLSLAKQHLYRLGVHCPDDGSKITCPSKYNKHRDNHGHDTVPPEGEDNKWPGGMYPSADLFCKFNKGTAHPREDRHPGWDRLSSPRAKAWLRIFFHLQEHYGLGLGRRNWLRPAPCPLLISVLRPALGDWPLVSIFDDDLPQANEHIIAEEQEAVHTAVNTSDSSLAGTIENSFEAEQEVAQYQANAMQPTQAAAHQGMAYFQPMPPAAGQSDWTSTNGSYASPTFDAQGGAAYTTDPTVYSYEHAPHNLDMLPEGQTAQASEPFVDLFEGGATEMPHYTSDQLYQGPSTHTRALYDEVNNMLPNGAAAHPFRTTMLSGMLEIGTLPSSQDSVVGGTLPRPDFTTYSREELERLCGKLLDQIKEQQTMLNARKPF